MDGRDNSTGHAPAEGMSSCGPAIPPIASPKRHGTNIEIARCCRGLGLEEATMRLILFIIVIILLLGALPTWPYSSGWGYYPSGGLGLVLLIVIILVLIGRI